MFIEALQVRWQDLSLRVVVTSQAETNKHVSLSAQWWAQFLLLVCEEQGACVCVWWGRAGTGHSLTDGGGICPPVS